MNDPDGLSGAELLDAKVYRCDDGHSVSMQDMLDYFWQRGTLRVSDLHLKIGCPPTYRLDGQLQKMKGPPLDAETIGTLIGAVLSRHDLEVLEAERGVDSSYFTATQQFRLNCFHDQQGPAVAIRALDQSPPEIHQIGFPNAVWSDIVQRQHGLVLITGITGAGKSTTIASLINQIAQQRSCRIITLEDPIEYRLASHKAMISQRQVGRHVPSFARGLRDALREDPDVIFVGEMRDRESTSWTLTAAETGHLVFSTLHTRDSRGALTRLLDMFPPDRQEEIASQLSLGLSHIISQKLVPRADGQGRVVAMEILNNNNHALANLIRTCKIEQIYSQLQTRTRNVPEERMVTLESSLARLVCDDRVKPDDGALWSNQPNQFAAALAHLRSQQEREEGK